MKINQTVFNTLTCRNCGSGEMNVRTSMPWITEHTQTVLRTKECRKCGHTYQTAEIDLTIAKEVLQEDDEEHEVTK